MHHNHEEVITSTLTADELVPVAQRCIEEINRIREEQDLKYLSDYMIELNSRWWHRNLFKPFEKPYKSIEDIKKYMKNDDSMFPDWLWKYPSACHLGTEKCAQDIIDYFKSIRSSPISTATITYTIPISIYNKIRTFCNEK